MTKTEFQILYHQLYSPLCNYATAIVNDSDSAEDIVQEVLYQFWEKRKELAVEPNKYENYLVRAVKFKCIDSHRQEKVKRKYEDEIVNTTADVNYSEDPQEVDYQEILFTAIAQLPEKTRAVFTMSKIDGLKYNEIAKYLDISVKTVENQMGRAFKILRNVIKKEQLFLLIIIFISQ